MLLTVEDTGHLEEIQAFEMGDRPLTLQVSKVSITGGKEVKGAGMAVYEMDGQGNVSVQPLMVRRPAEGGAYEEVEASWVSGMDGIYTREEAEAGEIPDMRSIMLSKTEYDGRMAVSLSSHSRYPALPPSVIRRGARSPAQIHTGCSFPGRSHGITPSGADSISSMIFSASSEAPVGTAV